MTSSWKLRSPNMVISLVGGDVTKLKQDIKLHKRFKDGIRKSAMATCEFNSMWFRNEFFSFLFFSFLFFSFLFFSFLFFSFLSFSFLFFSFLFFSVLFCSVLFLYYLDNSLYCCNFIFQGTTANMRHYTMESPC